MFTRTVLVKLTDEWSTHKGRTTIAEHSQITLSAVPGVASASAMVPADSAALESWDIMLQIHFETYEDIEPYRVHPDHLAFLNDYLSPKAEIKKVWNWGGV